MLNISFEKVISLSKKYNSMDDPYTWHRMKFLTQIVSSIIWAQGNPNEITLQSPTVNGKEIVQIANEIFKDLEISTKLKSRGKTRAIFLVK